MSDNNQEIGIQEKSIIEPKVSIIVPAYNTEKYLQKCLESLINQT